MRRRTLKRGGGRKEMGKDRRNWRRDRIQRKECGGKQKVKMQREGGGGGGRGRG